MNNLYIGRHVHLNDGGQYGVIDDIVRYPGAYTAYRVHFFGDMVNGAVEGWYLAEDLNAAAFNGG